VHVAWVLPAKHGRPVENSGSCRGAVVRIDRRFGSTLAFPDLVQFFEPLQLHVLGGARVDV
jgi:hypothetical protein